MNKRLLIAGFFAFLITLSMVSAYHYRDRYYDRYARQVTYETTRYYDRYRYDGYRQTTITTRETFVNSVSYSRPYSYSYYDYRRDFYSPDRYYDPYRDRQYRYDGYYDGWRY